MSITILIKKLNLDENKFIENTLIREYCRKLNLDYNIVIRYLTSKKYLYRIFKGIFYKPSIKERKLGILEIDYLSAVIEALKRKKIKNWYFGLDTAIKFNNLTHEHFAVDFIINDTIFRAKPITILGRKIKFVKLKKELCRFGIKTKNSINFSDIEKTVLDIIYLSRYEGLGKNEIKPKITDLLKNCSKVKLLRYSKEYNTKVKKFIDESYE